MAKNNGVIIIIGLNAFILISIIILFILNLNKLNYPLIIHFSKSEGVNIIGNKSDFISINLLGFSFILINYFLGYKIWFKDRISGYLLYGSNILISIIMLIFTITVIQNN